MMKTSYSITENGRRHWVLKDGMALGAIVANNLRAYVYPFCSPAGVNMVQDAPPDHPHHTGIMVGQDFLNGHNFWCLGNPKFPRNIQKIQEISADADESGATIQLSLCWVTEGSQSVMMEDRVLRFEQWGEFNFLDVVTRWRAAFGPIHVEPTKEGGLGMRVHPHLETFWGGTIRSSEGCIGEKAVFDRNADWVEVSGQIEGRRAGIVMMPHPGQKRVPWFVRDYGIHLFSPFRSEALHLESGESMQLRVGFAAYDGGPSGGQATKAWERYRALS